MSLRKNTPVQFNICQVLEEEKSPVLDLSKKYQMLM